MNPYVEKQIELKKYFVSIMRYWWLAILVSVLCSTVMATFMYINEKQDNDKLRAELNSGSQATDDVNVEEIKASLNMVDYQNVQLAVKYYELIKVYVKYKEESLYLSLDPSNVDKTIITYMIKLDDAEELSFEEQQVIKDNIVSSFVNYISTGTFANEIEKEIEIIPQYIQELVRASKNSTDSYSLDTFDITIINVKDLDDLSAYVKNNIENYAEDIEATFGSFSIQIIEEHDTTVIEDSLFDSIQGVQTDIYNATTRLNALMKNFTEEQLICYNDAIGVIDEMELEVEDTLEDELTQNIQPAKLNIKYIIVGFILGLVLYCGLILVWFMFTSKVLAVSGFESMFGVKLFGVLLPESMYGKKTSLLRKIEYGDLKSVGYSTVIGLLAIKVKAACKGINKLAVISSDFDSINEDIYTSLKERLSSEGIELVEIKEALSDGKDLEKMISIGNCIALEKAGSTKIKNFAMLKELCTECDIKLHGVVNVN